MAATQWSHRKISRTAGVLYLLTFVSIPTLLLYSSVKGTHYVTGAGPDTAAMIGGLLEIIVALAGIGTAVVLFPMLKKQNEGLALGLVASRVLEAATIFVGVAFLLTIVSLRRDDAGSDLLASSRVLVALYDRIFLLGQSFMPAVDDLLLGWLLYQSRLVPRALSRLGIIGALVLFAGYLAVMLGLVRPARFAGRTLGPPGRDLRVLARCLARGQGLRPRGRRRPRGERRTVGPGTSAVTGRGPPAQRRDTDCSVGARDGSPPAQTSRPMCTARWCSA